MCPFKFGQHKLKYMHETLCNDVKGHIDTSDINGIFSGWTYHVEKGVLPLRISGNNNVLAVNVLERQDVASFFKNTNITLCGWSVNTEFFPTCALEMLIDGNWTCILNLRVDTRPPAELFKVELFSQYKLPTFVVVDNFYKNPDLIREFAL